MTEEGLEFRPCEGAEGEHQRKFRGEKCRTGINKPVKELQLCQQTTASDTANVAGIGVCLTSQLLQYFAEAHRVANDLGVTGALLPLILEHHLELGMDVQPQIPVELNHSILPSFPLEDFEVQFGA